MAKATKKDKEITLETVLWNCRVALRGVGSTEKNRDAVIGLAFLKFAGDKFEKRRAELLAQYGDIPVFLEKPSFYNAVNVFYLKETARWSYIVKNAGANDIAVILDQAMADIEEANPSLKGALLQNFYATLGAPKEKIKTLIDEVNKISESRFHEEDLIGRVYEYFLQIYAASGTKEDGEFYTPACVVKLIAEMIEPFSGTVYDPCCGSGGMFVQSHKFVERHQGNRANISVVGQESVPDTWRLCKMNLAIRGISHDLGEKNASTFTDDQHKDRKFDFIMANPPFNLKGWRGEDELLDDPRWNGYVVPRASNANYAWILHIISKLDVNHGIAGFLLANGALNDPDEYENRKRLLMNDKVEAIIVLPRDMFYTTDISVTLWIVNMNKTARTVNGRQLRDRSGEVFLAIRPAWGEKRRAENENDLTKEQLDKLSPLPKINLVATQGANDEKELYEACGTKEYRKMLDKQFKNDNSNFKIAVVVDMWITGFDVPSLAVMYIDKPLQKHTLIQTISRVNRVFDGKDKGLVVDYIGIKNDMMEAIKKYGGPQESPVDELDITIGIFRNHLKMIDDLLLGFNASKFFTGEPLERLNCLNSAAEYVQSRKDTETRFMGLSRRLKSAYNICFPSGELTDEETAKAQFYLAIRSIIYKQTKGNAPDAEAMNQVVENMVREAIACTGIENVVDEHKSVDLFSDEFIEQLNTVKLPITKFNALLKLLRKAISAYGRTNKVKAMEFDERLRKVVDDYNSRDKLVFTNEVVSDFVNDLSDQLLQILRDLQEDQSSFQKMGISFEEKAFYDILVKVRDDHGFPYADEKCVVLAKKIKELVDDKAQFADWSTRDDIKNQLNMELTVLLYQNGYPPEWDEEVFEKVMEQAENFKKYAD